MPTTSTSVFNLLPFPKAPCPWCTQPISIITYHRRHFIGLGVCHHCGNANELHRVIAAVALYIAILVASAVMVKPLTLGIDPLWKMTIAVSFIYGVLWGLVYYVIDIRRYQY